MILGCVIGYTFFSVALTLFIFFKQKDIIMITKCKVPPVSITPVTVPLQNGSPLRVSSTLPKFSEKYTVTVESHVADVDM